MTIIMAQMVIKIIIIMAQMVTMAIIMTGSVPAIRIAITRGTPTHITAITPTHTRIRPTTITQRQCTMEPITIHIAGMVHGIRAQATIPAAGVDHIIMEDSIETCNLRNQEENQEKSKKY